MRTELTATVIGGLLKPDDRLLLPDQTRVKLTIEPLADSPDAVAALDAWNAIKTRLQQRPIYGVRHYTRDELHERR